MSAQSKGRSGWFVPRPAYMKEVPTKRSDLLRLEHNIQGTQVPQVVFDTEAEAEKDAIRLLVELKQDAEWKIVAYSEPSADVKERERQFFLEEAKRLLTIADAGLTLLNVSALQIEELSGFHAVE
jgi:hypothetical protein